MVAKATSKHVTNLQTHETRDRKLDEALVELLEQSSKPKQEQLSMWMIAYNKKVSLSTLSCRYSGM